MIGTIIVEFTYRDYQDPYKIHKEKVVTDQREWSVFVIMEGES